MLCSQQMNLTTCRVPFSFRQAIQEAAKSVSPGLMLDVRIKWPNDIYYRGLKIGGALINSSWQSGHFSVLTGMNINKNMLCI